MVTQLFVECHSEESGTSRVLKKNYLFFNEMENGLTERYKRERGPGPSVTAGVPFSFLFF